jgi:translation initiation factor IF-1
MAGESAFQVEGVIVEALPNRTYRAVLSNGHELLAFVAGKAREKCGRLGPGTRVKLQMSPYDLSTGRILVETNSSLI